jgi:hypothetical protein
MGSTHFRISKKTIGILMVIPSSIFVIFGFVFLLNSVFFCRNAVTTSAKIVELIERRSSDDGFLYQPVFVFTDNIGQQHTVESNYSSNPPIGEVGDTIEIIYQPSDTENARIKSFFSLYGFPLIPLVLGSILCLVGVGFIISYYRNLSISSNGNQP